jgi:hypothetical protein
LSREIISFQEHDETISDNSPCFPLLFRRYTIHASPIPSSPPPNNYRTPPLDTVPPP